MIKNIFKHMMITWQHHGALQFTTTVVLIATFALISSISSVSHNLDKVLTLWGETMQMAVYLNEDATDTQKQEVENLLKGAAEVGKIHFVNKEEALNEFNTQMKSYAPGLAKDKELLQFIPSSFQVSLAAAIPVSAHLSALKGLSAKLEKMAGVEEVSYGQEWVKNFTSVITSIHTLGIIFIMVFLAGSAFVISTSIKTSINQRKNEIEVLELIGATSWYIRLPYIVEGGLLGAATTILGLFFAYLGFNFFVEYVGAHLSFLELAENMEFLRPSQIVLIFLGGTIGGLLSSWLCVRSLNSGWLAAKG